MQIVIDICRFRKPGHRIHELLRLRNILRIGRIHSFSKSLYAQHSRSEMTIAVTVFIAEGPYPAPDFILPGFLVFLMDASAKLPKKRLDLFSEIHILLFHTLREILIHQRIQVCFLSCGQFLLHIGRHQFFMVLPAGMLFDPFQQLLDLLSTFFIHQTSRFLINSVGKIRKEIQVFPLKMLQPASLQFFKPSYISFCTGLFCCQAFFRLFFIFFFLLLRFPWHLLNPGFQLLHRKKLLRHFI